MVALKERRRTMMSIETNRRDALAGAAVSGLVSSVLTTPVAAQSTGVMATATEADYKRDPTRWGSADMASHFPGRRSCHVHPSANHGVGRRGRKFSPIP